MTKLDKKKQKKNIEITIDGTLLCNIPIKRGNVESLKTISPNRSDSDIFFSSLMAKAMLS